MLRPLLVALAVSLACVTLALAQEVAINPTDSVKVVIVAQKEKRITLRLRIRKQRAPIWLTNNPVRNHDDLL